MGMTDGVCQSKSERGSSLGCGEQKKTILLLFLPIPCLFLPTWHSFGLTLQYSCWHNWDYLPFVSFWLLFLLYFPPWFQPPKPLAAAMENQILVKMQLPNRSELAQFWSHPFSESEWGHIQPLEKKNEVKMPRKERNSFRVVSDNLLAKCM